MFYDPNLNFVCVVLLFANSVLLLCLCNSVIHLGIKISTIEKSIKKIEQSFSINRADDANNAVSTIKEIANPEVKAAVSKALSLVSDLRIGPERMERTTVRPKNKESKAGRVSRQPKDAREISSNDTGS